METLRQGIPNPLNEFHKSPFAITSTIPQLPHIRRKTWDSYGPCSPDGIPYGSGLHRAVIEGRYHQVKLLLSFGVNADKRDVMGRTPLMLTTMIDSELIALRMMRFLIRAGVLVNLQDFTRRSALAHACVRGKTTLVEILLRQDNIEKNCIDNNGDSPLNLAAACGYGGIVSMLVVALQRDGLPTDIRNKQGCTALLLATKYGHFGCAEILLNKGRSSLSSRDNESFMNPTEWARYTHNRHQKEIKKRLSTIFGREGDEDQEADIATIGQFPRKYIPPFQNVSQEINMIDTLRRQQSSLTELIESFEMKERESPDLNSTVASERAFSDVSDETYLLQDTKSKGTPIKEDLTNIFRLYQEQLKSRPQAKSPEIEAEIELEVKIVPPAGRRKSTFNFAAIINKKKNMIGGLGAGV